MIEKATWGRIETSLRQEQSLDQIIEAQGEKLRASIEEYKGWLAIELRKAHQQVAMLTQEKEVLIKQVLQLRKTIVQIKTALKE